MARMTTGKDSKQDYRTTKQLIEAIEARFGKITVDLAADFTNKVADLYFCAPDTPGITGPDALLGCLGVDCLVQDWTAWQHKHLGLYFDNCPFNSIMPFSNKHREEMVRGAETLLLIPDDATKAYMANVIGHADVYRLVGRVPFKINQETGQKESFPKDCAICHYKPNNDRPKYYFWDWKRNKILHTFIIE